MFVDQLRNPGRPLRALWSNPGTDHTTVRAGMWSSATAMAHSSAALAHKASAKSERFVVHTVIYRNAPSQRGVRTLHGHEEDACGDFDVVPATDAQEEGPPPLGSTPGPQGRPQSRGSAGGCF